ncbi:hypothetical protein [Streptomyces sp. NPDC046985]|uniref:hypothetical protein n=1 Tax=Streptomyces sp. NPDC046985 TaxID=3155377 RepID=UPI003403253F
MGHHKSNQEVEGNPEFGHGRGLPLRPDQEELRVRTEVDRQEAGLTPSDAPSAQQIDETAYTEAEAEVDRQVRQGVIPSDDAARDAYPPTRYDDR